MENKQKYVKMNKKGATGLNPFITGLIVTIFFAFCIVGFVINFIGSKNPTSPIIISSTTNLSAVYNNITNSVGNFTGTVTDMRGQLADASPDPINYVFLIFKGAFFIPWTILSFAMNGITLVTNLLFYSIVPNTGGAWGVVGLIFTTSITILVFGLLLTAIFLLIKTVRTGESER